MPTTHNEQIVEVHVANWTEKPTLGSGNAYGSWFLILIIRQNMFKNILTFSKYYWYLTFSGANILETFDTICSYVYIGDFTEYNVWKTYLICDIRLVQALYVHFSKDRD